MFSDIFNDLSFPFFGLVFGPDIHFAPIWLSYARRSPPLEVQPSFGRFFSKVNDAWIQGFKGSVSNGGHWSRPTLSDVVVVSIAGGSRDYQVCAEI